ncbi:hypothetical protein MRX96_053360 [Rhipicephalus microplus]
MTAGKNGMGKFLSCMVSLDRKVPVCELRDESTKEKVILRDISLPTFDGYTTALNPTTRPLLPQHAGLPTPKAASVK